MRRIRKSRIETGVDTPHLPNPGWSPKKWSGPIIPVYDRPGYLPPGPEPHTWNDPDIGDLRERPRKR